MNVLVSGGAGFIGSHLVRHHLALGDRVTAVDNLSTGSAANVAPFLASDRFRFDDPGWVRHEYGLELTPLDALPRADCVVMAVPHDTYLERRSPTSRCRSSPAG